VRGERGEIEQEKGRERGVCVLERERETEGWTVREIERARTREREVKRGGSHSCLSDGVPLQDLEQGLMDYICY
jgi:hypothetical protein